MENIIKLPKPQKELELIPQIKSIKETFAIAS